MRMVKENHSISKGLDLIEIMARDGPCSLARLHELSGIPKSTLRRILLTLETRKFARRSLADGKYRLTVNLPMLSREPVSSPWASLLEATFSHTLELTRRINWPSDIHVREDPWMRIMDSTRAVSAFSLFQGRPDRRVHLFGSATGVACLAHEQIGEVYKLFHDPNIEAIWSPRRIGLVWQKFEQTLLETKARGYGTRLSQHLGETTLDDKLNAIAVPLIHADRAVGGISILFPKDLMSAEEFASEFLPDLRQTAKSAEKDLAKL